MANIKKTRMQNTPGDYFVDENCINCGTCYSLAPDVFKEIGDKSAVIKQPGGKDEWNLSAIALKSCPVLAIGNQSLSREKISELDDLFPVVIAEDVYHTGFHSEASFGAAPYYIQSKKIMIDAPRFSGNLANRLQALGGIDLQIITHSDDIAATDKYHDFFGSKRLMHKDDCSNPEYEVKIEGDDTYAVDENTLVIPVPGHTRGHVVILYGNTFLFTGDHLSYSSNIGQLISFRHNCWYDFKIQIESMQKLMDYDFEYVLPAHGERFYATKSQMKTELLKCIERMKKLL